MQATEATHYHCACKECYWGTIVESADIASEAVWEHEQKTGHAWSVRSLEAEGRRGVGQR